MEATSLFLFIYENIILCRYLEDPLLSYSLNIIKHYCAIFVALVKRFTNSQVKKEEVRHVILLILCVKKKTKWRRCQTFGVCCNAVNGSRKL